MCQKHPVSEAGDASGPSFPNIPSHGAAEVLMCQKLPVPEAEVASNGKAEDVPFSKHIPRHQLLGSVWCASLRDKKGTSLQACVTAWAN